MQPAEVSNNVNALDNGDAAALVSYNWNPAANGIVPPQPGGYIDAKIFKPHERRGGGG